MGTPKPRRTKNLNIRLSPAEARVFALAAEREGLPLSQWVRRTLLAASRKGAA